MNLILIVPSFMLRWFAANAAKVAARLTRSKGYPIFRLSGNFLSLNPQYGTASLQSTVLITKARKIVNEFGQEKFNVLIIRLINQIISVVGNHSKSVELHSFRCSFRQQHMRWPSTSTESEGCSLCISCWFISYTHSSESPVVWYSDG